MRAGLETARAKLRAQARRALRGCGRALRRGAPRHGRVLGKGNHDPFISGGLSHHHARAPPLRQLTPKAALMHRLHWKSTVKMTNSDGVIEYTRTKYNAQVEAIVTGDDNRMSFSFFQGWREDDPRNYWEHGPRHYIVTDRPAYRSGDTVKFSIWFRELVDRKYGPVRPGQQKSIRIYDARNNLAHEMTVETDSAGCASGEFQLGEEPPLGVYHIRVDGYPPDARRVGGGLFRVEEYKLPESD